MSDDPIRRTTARPDPPSVDSEIDLPRMTFLEHLDELRRRLVRAAIAVGIGFAVALTWAKPIFGWLARPLDGVLPEGQRSLVYLHPIDPFMLYMKVGLLAGIFLASPAVLWQLWAFLSPGLYPKERKLAAPFLVSTVGLFLAGGWFGYAWAYPAALRFLIGEMGADFRSGITIDNYFDLTAKIILALGVVFEIPVLIFFLSRFGLVTPGWLLRNFRYAILVIAILAAVLTPTPDMFNMFLFMAPMIVLYLLGIFVAWLFGKNPRKEEGGR